MSNEADVTDLAAALARLTPTATAADPVAAAYAAGRAAGRRTVVVWRTAAAAALVAGVGLRFTPVSRPTPTATPVAVVSPPVQPLVWTPSRPAELVRVEEALLDHGLAGLPPSPRRPTFPPPSPF